MIAEEVAVLEGGPFGLVTWGAEQVVDDIDRDLEDGLGAMPGDCLTYQEREAEITELKVSPINLVDSFKLNIDELDFLYQHDGKLFGKESGEISIKNTSTETFTPNPKFRMQALDTTPAGNDVDVQHPIAVNDPIPKLEPQEEATISFEYAVPLSEKGTSSYKFIAELKNGSGKTTQEFDTGYINFDFGETFDLLSGVINPGESSEEKHQPESETENITYELNYDNNDVDLHVTDDQDNHAGMNYKDGTFENEIPGLTHSGNDNGQIGNEYATIQDAQSSEYSVEAIAPDVGTIIQGSSEPTSVSASQSDGGLGSSFDINTTEVSTSELVGEIDVSSKKISGYKGEAETLDSTIVVEELKQSNPLDSVSLEVGELTAQSSSSTIPEDDITIGSTGFDLDAGQLREVDMEVSVPAETAIGTYTTDLQASANDGDTTDTTELVVEIFPEKPDVTIGSGQKPPQDVDQDGLFEDINGDGEFDISDIQLLFNNLSKEAVQDNPAAFNFSETENPAEVTVSDVQALYDNLMEEQQ
jgi:hypothetical protein